MPEVKLQIEIECEDKFCGLCDHMRVATKYGRLYCVLFGNYLDEYSDGKWGRDKGCLAAEVKEEGCKWTIEYSTVKLSEVSTSCGITATWHNGIKFDFCPYCGKKVV